MCGYNQYASNFESLRNNNMGCYLTYLVNSHTESINFWIRAENINNFGYYVDTTGFIWRASTTADKAHAVPAKLIYYDTSLLV